MTPRVCVYNTLANGHTHVSSKLKWFANDKTQLIWYPIKHGHLLPF
jgi:hypothetical protein